MKKTKRKLYAVTMCLLILCCPLTLFAHSGRTDSNGGHKDNQNKSGLGSYHYHCGGNPPHLHEGGVCPYASSTAAPQDTTSQSTTSQESSATTTQTVTPTVVQDKITVRNYESEMYVGDNQSFEFDITSTSSDVSPTISSSDSSVVSVNGTKLTAQGVGTATITVKTDSAKKSFSITVKEVYAESLKLEVIAQKIEIDDTARITATIMPENTTDKSITYTSSDEEIATVSSKGEIKGISSGTVVITATTSNNISESIEIEVIDVQPAEIKCQDSIALIVGDSHSLKVEVLPEDSKNKEYTVTCEDEDILKYSDGELQAVSEGTTSLRIETWNGIVKEIPVQVDIVPVETVTIIDTTGYMHSNVLDQSSEILLQAEVLPAEATYPDVSWSSSDENIVAIEDGKFMIKDTGKVTLTCTTKENVSDSIEIEIVDKNARQSAGAIGLVGVAAGVAAVVYLKKKKTK